MNNNSKLIITAGKTIMMFVLNLSFIFTSCVLVAAIVVSEIKDKLSPNIAPPTTIPLTNATLIPVLDAILMAIGINAVTVPIEVPIEKLSKHPIRNKPGKIILLGNIVRPRFTTESTACIPLATP